MFFDAGDFYYEMEKENPEVDWIGALEGWVPYYDDGIITLNPNVFFEKKTEKVISTRPLKKVYWPWRTGYANIEVD